MRLAGYLEDAGKGTDGFPNALATMFFYVTEDRKVAERILTEVVSPAINRPAEELAERLPIGPAEECAEKLAAYASAAVQSVYVWPTGDYLQQLETFWDRVVPLVEAAGA